VRNTNHRHLSYRLMLIQGFFHVPAGHQNAAGIHHVFNPVNDIDVALLVTVTEGAGVEPTTLEGLFCGFMFLPVTDPHKWRPVHNSAMLFWLVVLSGGRVNDPGHNGS